MAFIINSNEKITSIIDTSSNKVLSYLPEDVSLSQNKEFCILSSDSKDLDTYTDIEQALDDFEFYTSRIPTRVIKSFKNKAINSNFTFISNKSFIVERDNNFSSITDTNANIQLCYFKDLSSQDSKSYFIVNTDFEPIQSFEKFSVPFTNDLEIALMILHGMYNKTLPEDTLQAFKDSIRGIEFSNAVELNTLSKNMFSYNFKDFQIVFNSTSDSLCIESNSLDHIYISYFDNQIFNIIISLYPQIDMIEVQEVLNKFRNL